MCVLSTALAEKPRFIRIAGPAILYALAIFILSSLPGAVVPTLGFRFGDKILHLAEYGILGFLLYRAFRGTPRPFLLTILTGVIYAASDEFHQLFVPGRYCDFWDFAADVVGLALLGVIAGMFYGRHRR